MLDQKFKNQVWNVFRRKSIRAMSGTPRRSRKGTEADDEVLSAGWTCLLSYLTDIEPDLRNWPLCELYAVDLDDQGERIGVELNFECPASVLAQIEAFREITFHGGRHLGQEPGGLELFGAYAGKGCDPRMNREEKSIVAEFFRNLDNWASLLLDLVLICVFQALNPVCASMGPEHGGLLQLAMGSMPNVVWELHSKVDVNRTFYESANRNAKATSSACDLTNLGRVLLEETHFTEAGFPEG